MCAPTGVFFAAPVVRGVFSAAPAGAAAFFVFTGVRAERGEMRDCTPCCCCALLPPADCRPSGLVLVLARLAGPVPARVWGAEAALLRAAAKAWKEPATACVCKIVCVLLCLSVCAHVCVCDRWHWLCYDVCSRCATGMIRCMSAIVLAMCITWDLNRSKRRIDLLAGGEHLIIDVKGESIQRERHSCIGFAPGPSPPLPLDTWGSMKCTDKKSAV